VGIGGILQDYFEKGQALPRRSFPNIGSSNKKFRKVRTQLELLPRGGFFEISKFEKY